MQPTMTKEEWQRLRELRDARDQRDLSVAEQAELSVLLQRAEDTEMAQIAPALDRMDIETGLLKQKNKALSDLAAQKQNLVDRLESLLSELQREQSRIDAEISRLLSPNERLRI